MSDVNDDRTRERAARIRAAGAILCGPVPPTDADLDVVEDFRHWLRERKSAWDVVAVADTSARIRAVADPLIEQGCTLEMIYDAVWQALGLGIGKGGGGDQDVLYPGPLGESATCPYCGATGGGGHGGFCPSGTAA